MINLKAIKRSVSSSGKINELRSEGFIPAILYGGSKENLPLSLKKVSLEDIVKTESFMSSVFNLEIDGQKEKVLPRDIALDPLSSEPIHIDFMRIVEGSKIMLEIPVRFINNDKSPGLKKGGVLNIVRRKIELKCPTENIPDEIVIDLENKEIGASIKISMVSLPSNVSPKIIDRDFTIATLVAPTIVVEPEKTTDEPAEGEVSEESPTDTVTDETDEQVDDKTKSETISDDKNKAPDKKEENIKKNK